MTVDDDLAGTTCSAAGCFQPADVIGVATMHLPALVGAVGTEEDPLVLEVPLCATKHAHLLRMGVDSCEFDSRL